MDKICGRVLDTARARRAAYADKDHLFAVRLQTRGRFLKDLSRTKYLLPSIPGFIRQRFSAMQPPDPKRPRTPADSTPEHTSIEELFGQALDDEINDQLAANRQHPPQVPPIKLPDHVPPVGADSAPTTATITFRDVLAAVQPYPQLYPQVSAQLLRLRETTVGPRL